MMVEELALARGLITDSERRDLRPPQKKTTTVSPFEENLFKTEWRERQEVNTDARCREQRP